MRREVVSARAAPLATLIEPCTLHGVTPEAYLACVLGTLVDNWPNRRLAERTRFAWQAAQATPPRSLYLLATTHTLHNC